MNEKNFTCWNCHKDFVSDEQSDEEVMQEARARYGESKEEMVIFCEDCFKAFMRWRGSGKVQG